MTISSVTSWEALDLGLAEETAGEPLGVAGDSTPEEDLGLDENNVGDADLRDKSKASFLQSKEGLALICERKGLGLTGPL